MAENYVLPQSDLENEKYEDLAKKYVSPSQLLSCLSDLWESSKDVKLEISDAVKTAKEWCKEQLDDIKKEIAKIPVEERKRIQEIIIKGWIKFPNKVEKINYDNVNLTDEEIAELMEKVEDLPFTKEEIEREKSKKIEPKVPLTTPYLWENIDNTPEWNLLQYRFAEEYSKFEQEFLNTPSKSLNKDWFELNNEIQFKKWLGSIIVEGWKDDGKEISSAEAIILAETFLNSMKQRWKMYSMEELDSMLRKIVESYPKKDEPEGAS